MNTHTEKIECPNCGDIQDAEVEHTTPFHSYVHYCTECEYMIGESEWNVCKEFLPNLAIT